LFSAGRLGIKADGKTLDGFVEDLHFWDWRRSRYVRGILARSDANKPKITRAYVDNGKAAYTRHIAPDHGSLAIDKITPADCEDLLFAWKGEGYSPKTINNWRSYYSTILGEAVRLGVIRDNPWDRVPGMAKASEIRGGLSLAEGSQVIRGELVDRSKPSHVTYHLATKLAFLTGLRISEVVGLYTDDVRSRTVEIGGQEVTVYYIDVKYQQHDKEHKRTLTKDKEARAVPITPELYAELEPRLTGPGRYLFSHHPRQETPLTHNLLRDWYNGYLDRLGIDRQGRNIKFHSGRRFFNTLLRRHVSGDVLRKMTGHDSEEMTEHYTDYLPEDLALIGQAQASILLPDNE
jgi:integrase